MNEQCENDILASSADGCSDNCMLESGWNCITVNHFTFCTGICGDGIVVSDEICDDGDTDGIGCLANC